MSQQAAGSRSPLEHADHTMGEESEDSWASGSVRVTVRWPESPRPPCPVIPGCAERWGQGAAGAVAPGSVQSSLPGLGRYNNQWMIVDYKVFVPGRPSPGSGVLTILEQIP